MKIGITYDLRDEYRREGYGEEETAEFDSIETIAAIEFALRSLGHSTDRIGHARSLAQRLTQGDGWDLVFNIAEGLQGFGREALVPALLDAYEIPYTFSDPLTLSVALHKGMAKRIVRDLGIRTAAFAVIEHLADLDDVALGFPLFVKPVAEGTSKGISGASKIGSLTALRSACANLLKRYRQPVLVEAFLPGREFTVGVLGSGSDAITLGVLEVLLQDQAEPDVYSYQNKKDYERCVRYRLAQDRTADDATDMALAVWKGLGCRDGGRVDLRCDGEGRVNFIEVNPLAGLDPNHSDLVILSRAKGISYTDLIGRILASAIRRVEARTDDVSRQLRGAA